MKDKWNWIERGISLTIIIGVAVGWIIAATVNRTKNELAREYWKAEMVEMKEDIKEVKRTVEDTNDKVHENTNNITKLATLADDGND